MKNRKPIEPKIDKPQQADWSLFPSDGEKLYTWIIISILFGFSIGVISLTKLTDFAAVVISSTTIIAVIAFIFKSLIKQWLDRDLKSFEEKLKAQSEITRHQMEQQLTEYKSKLEIQRTRLQIKYGGIFEKQANVIIELNKQLYSFKDIMNSQAFEAAGSNAIDYSVINQAFRNFTNYLDENSVLIPKDIEDSINEYIKTYFYSTQDKLVGHNRLNRQISSTEIEKLLNKINSSHDVIYGLEEILKNIKIRLRTLIGTCDEG